MDTGFIYSISEKIFNDTNFNDYWNNDHDGTLSLILDFNTCLGPKEKSNPAPMRVQSSVTPRI